MKNAMIFKLFLAKIDYMTRLTCLQNYFFQKMRALEYEIETISTTTTKKVKQL